MSLILYGVTFLGTTAALAVGGTYTILSAEQIAKSKNYKKNDSLKAARKYLAIASSLAWAGIAMIIIIIILYIAFGIETIEYTGQSLVLLLLLITLGLVLGVGILAVIGASDIRKSGETTPEVEQGYRDAIIASVITIGGLALLIIGGISILYVQNAAANKRAAQNVEVQTLLYQRILEQNKLRAAQGMPPVDIPQS